MTRWLFVRHGQSEANRDGWYAGGRDSPLTALGRTQAQAARAAVAGIRFTNAISSDLSRAEQTARIIVGHEGIPLVTTAKLRERCAGTWEGCAIADVRAKPGGDVILATWAGRPPEGESLRDVAIRSSGWLAEQRVGDGPVLVVAHGALMRALLGALDDCAPERIGAWHPGNCEVAERDVAPGAWGELHERLVRQADAK